MVLEIGVKIKIDCKDFTLVNIDDDAGFPLDPNSVYATNEVTIQRLNEGVKSLLMARLDDYFSCDVYEDIECSTEFKIFKREDVTINVFLESESFVLDLKDEIVVNKLMAKLYKKNKNKDTIISGKLLSKMIVESKFVEDTSNHNNIEVLLLRSLKAFLPITKSHSDEELIEYMNKFLDSGLLDLDPGMDREEIIKNVLERYKTNRKNIE
jgi:hypothetical protein